MIKELKRNDQEGFTIVELLIATAVLSTLLVVVSVMMANIGRLYYKGINQAKMQENVRSVVDDISERLQLNNSNVLTANNGAVGAYCIGATRYTYVIGAQLKDDPDPGEYKHVLWRDTISPGTCSVANLMLDNPSSNGSELITTRSRLTQFSINRTASPYVVTMKLVYGDNDQIDDPSIPGVQTIGAGVKCLSQAGNQFCATASLTTTVVQRTTGGN